MPVEARVVLQPQLHSRSLGGLVVVADQMHVQALGDVGVDPDEELPELDCPVLRCRLEITDPSAVFSAANRVVVPCRT